ncbi:hypothetical protein Tco_0067289 [Tanacetum coccineum]
MHSFALALEVTSKTEYAFQIMCVASDDSKEYVKPISKKRKTVDHNGIASVDSKEYNKPVSKKSKTLYDYVLPKRRQGGGPKGKEKNVPLAEEIVWSIDGVAENPVGNTDVGKFYERRVSDKDSEVNDFVYFARLWCPNEHLQEQKSGDLLIISLPIVAL